MNVYDNLAYGLKIRGVPKEEIAKKVAEPESFFESPKSEISRKFVNGELEF